LPFVHRLSVVAKPRIFFFADGADWTVFILSLFVALFTEIFAVNVIEVFVECIRAIFTTVAVPHILVAGKTGEVTVDFRRVAELLR
jgi:hypothetical protein